MTWLLLLLACRSVSGSEGFVVQDAVLTHEAGSESTEVDGNYERTFTGRWSLLAWGGGDCPGYVPPEPPDGEGWEEQDEESGDLPSLCESIQESGREVYVSATGGPSSRFGLSVYLEDTPQVQSGSWAYLTECGPPETESEMSVGYSLTEKVSDAVEEFAISVEGGTAEVRFAVGAKLSANWRMPVCEIN